MSHAAPKHTWLNSEAPRERLREVGAAALSDGELLAVLAGSGHASSGNALELARGLLARFGDLRRLSGVGTSELCSVPGLGNARASRLEAAWEIGRRVHSRELKLGCALTSSEQVFKHFGPLLSELKRERFYGLLLDSKNRLLRKAMISEGSLGASLVHPREAFRPAVCEAAAAVIFMHNHPSGDPGPSSEDRRITARLRRAGEILGIPVLDHVVVGRDGYFSFADSGWE